MNFRDLTDRLLQLEKALIRFNTDRATRHRDIVGKAASRPMKRERHSITWAEVKPASIDVDSWTTRIGALAVTSGLLSLDDELQGSARSIVTFMAVVILALSYAPLWRYWVALYQKQKMSRTIRDSCRLVVPFSVTTILALGALPIFSLSTQNLLNYLMSADGRYTILAVFLIWVGIFLCLGEYRRLTQSRDDDEPEA